MLYEIENRCVRKSVHQFLEVFNRFTVAPSILLASMLMVIMASPIQAQQKTDAGPSVGGPGGGDYSYECPAGSYMGALKAHHGAWIDSVAVVCRKLSGRALVPGATSKYGGNSGGVERSDATPKTWESSRASVSWWRTTRTNRSAKSGSTVAMCSSPSSSSIKRCPTCWANPQYSSNRAPLSAGYVGNGILANMVFCRPHRVAPVKAP